MSVGERLTLLRKTLEINQTDMAMAIGCSQANVSKYERNGTAMSIEFLIPLRKAYNVNLDWLLLGIGEMFVPITCIPQPSENHSTLPEPPNKQRLNELSAELQRISEEIKDCIGE